MLQTVMEILKLAIIIGVRVSLHEDICWIHTLKLIDNIDMGLFAAYQEL